MERNKIDISLGILASYDYEYLKEALPRIYKYVNYIVIAIDKYKKTWKGDEFTISEDFYVWLENIDLEKKIQIYEYEIDPSINSMEIETHLRNEMIKMMPKSDWYMQMDTDEYIINPDELFEKIATIDATNPVNLFGYWIPIFKSDKNGSYIINTLEEFPFLTNYPHYTKARHIEGIQIQKIDIFFLHQSWDRPEEEIKTKLKSWGHNTDFPIMDYFEFWKSINVYNYKYFRNFHPLDDGKMWPELVLSKDQMMIENIVNNLIEEKRNRNNIPEVKKTVRQRIKSILKRLKG